MIEARLAEAVGNANPTYAVLAGIEENLEVLGAILLLYALLRFAQMNQMSLMLTTGQCSPASRPPAMRRARAETGTRELTASAQNGNPPETGPRFHRGGSQ